MTTDGQKPTEGRGQRRQQAAAPQGARPAQGAARQGGRQQAAAPAAQAAPLADATIRALQDPALLSAYSAASRRMIADFTLDRVGQQLVSLFDAARGERPPTES